MQNVHMGEINGDSLVTNKDVIYDIPAHLVGAFRDRRVIVRSRDPAEIAWNVKPGHFAELIGIRLLDIRQDSGVLVRLLEQIPVELTLERPADDFHLLYRHTRLLDCHPVRLKLVVAKGASRAARLAMSLRFPVKLEVNQPDSEAVDELKSMLDFYLHNSAASHPIDFFHSLFAAMFNGSNISLWDVMEENPAQIRFVNNEGTEMMLRCEAGDANVTTGFEYFVRDFAEALIAGNSECCECEFFENCGGYFKWPLRKYPCSEIKPILAQLKAASIEIRSDLGRVASASAGGSQ